MIPTPLIARVPRRFAGETVACLGSGPSLCAEDVDALRGHARVLAINDAYRLAPWADVLYAADAKWWRWHKGVPGVRGQRYTIHPQPDAWPGLEVLRDTGREGLELDPSGLRTGYTSGYQAINLAVHLGASRILLLGYDLAGTHFFGQHPDQSVPPFDAARVAFRWLIAPLEALGIPVVNCSRHTTLTAFPRVPLAQALAFEVAS
jgi:hypothetical protein